MKSRELDLLIVVNMFLTGFDAKTLNTLWVDKNLKMHGLLQAYSRTNRILNSVKNCGNIVCFRNLEQATNDALGLFGNADAHGVILLKTFDEYYYEGYDDANGKHQPAYKETVEELRETYPLPVGTDVMSEETKKDFIKKYSYILKLYNILSTFDEFEGLELLGEQERQHYASAYLELHHQFRNKEKTNPENVNDDIAFEIELIKHDDISIDRILQMVQAFADEHMNDMELVAKIRNIVNASPDLRSKKDLIENFLKGITSGSDVGESWTEYIKQQKEEELKKIIEEEKLKPKPYQSLLKLMCGWSSMPSIRSRQHQRYLEIRI